MNNRKLETVKIEGKERKTEWKIEDNSPVRTLFITEEEKKLKTHFNFDSNTAITIEVSTKDNKPVENSGVFSTFRELEDKEEGIVRKASLYRHLLN